MIKVTNRRNKRRMKVRITQSAGWYKLDEIHEVGQYTTTGYGLDETTKLPHYECAKGGWGIDITHCKIIE